VFHFCIFEAVLFTVYTEFILVKVLSF